jgi:hypothetical protein
MFSLINLIAVRKGTYTYPASQGKYTYTATIVSRDYRGDPIRQFTHIDTGIIVYKGDMDQKKFFYPQPNESKNPFMAALESTTPWTQVPYTDYSEEKSIYCESDLLKDEATLRFRIYTKKGVDFAKATVIFKKSMVNDISLNISSIPNTCEEAFSNLLTTEQAYDVIANAVYFDNQFSE